MAIDSLNSKVYFKKGTQASFNSLQKFVEGTLYLTDENNLYYANGSAKGDIMQIHSGFHIVHTNGTEIVEGETIPIYQSSNKEVSFAQYLVDTYDNATPSKILIGDFFYSPEQNVLLYKNAVVKGVLSGYQQINPYCELTPSTEGLRLSLGENANTRLIGLNVKDNKNHTVSGNIKLVEGDNISFDTEADPTNPNALLPVLTINAVDTNTTYSVTAIAVDTDNDGDTDINDNRVDIKLIGSDNTSSSFALTGANGIKIGPDNVNGGIKITGTPTLDSVSTTFSSDGEFKTIVTQGTGVDSTSVESVGITPTIEYIDYDGGQTSTASAVFRTSEGSGSLIPKLALNVYSTTAVDNLIEEAKATLNAMTYRGPISSSDFDTKKNPSTTSCQNGDTYRASEDIYVGAVNIARKGDLIIYNGDDNGHFIYNDPSKPNNIEIVESGDEPRLGFSLDSIHNTLTFKDQNAAIGTENLAHLQFINDRGDATGTAAINIATSTATNNGVDVYKINITHGAPGSGTTVVNSTASATWTSANGLKIPGVQKLVKDDQGHITEVTITDYTIPKDNGSFTANDVTYDTDTTAAGITLGYTMNTYGGVPTSEAHSIRIQSETISVTASRATNNDKQGVFSVELEWGTF